MAVFKQRWENVGFLETKGGGEIRLNPHLLTLNNGSERYKSKAKITEKIKIKKKWKSKNVRERRAEWQGQDAKRQSSLSGFI